MLRSRAILSTCTQTAAALALSLLAALFATGAEPRAPRTDGVGDPLPDGAVARLGTSRWRHEGKVAFVAYADGGKQVVTSCGQGIIHVWDAETGRPVRTLGQRFKVQASGSYYDPSFDDDDDYSSTKPTCLVAVAMQGAGIAIAAPDGQVHVWDRTTGKELHTFKAPQKPSSIAFTTDGKSVVVRGRYDVVKVWSIEKQEFSGQYGKENNGSGRGSGTGGLIDPDDDDIWDYGSGRESSPVVSPDGKTVVRFGVRPRGSRGSFGSGTGGPPPVSSSGSGSEEDADAAYEMRLWKLGENKEFKKFKLKLDVSADRDNELTMPAFAADGESIAVCRSRGSIFVIDAKSGTVIYKIARKEGGSGDDAPRLVRLAISPDGKKLAAQAADGKVWLYDLLKGKELHQIGGEKTDDDPRKGSGSKWASGSGWGSGTGGYYSVSFVTEPTTIAWSADSKTVVEAQGRLVRLWDVASGKGNDISGGHLGEVTSVVAAKDGKTALTLGNDRTVRQWDVAKAKETKKVEMPDTFFDCVLVPPAGALVVTTDGAVSFWDPITDKFDAGLPKMSEDAFGRPDHEALTVSANRKTIVFGAGRVLIRSINLDKAAENNLFFVLDLTVPNLRSDPRLRALACSPDGQTLAVRIDLMPDRWRRRRGSGSAEDPPPPARAELRLFQIDRASLIWSRDVGAENCSALTFSPNGRTLAMINGKGEEITLTEAATGKTRARFKVAGASLAYSADGVFLGIGTQDGGVKVVDARDGKEIVGFSGHNGKVTSLAFSADASTLFSSSADGTVLVWDTKDALTKARSRPAISSDKAKELWEALADADGDRAYEAIGALSSSPKEAVAILKERMTPDKVMEEAQVDKLIGELNGDTFEGREKALRELGRTGVRFRHIFEDARSRELAPETAKQLDRLLAWLEPGNTMPDILRDSRAIEVLETLATPAARALLESLAGGARGSPLTREAATAVKRLGK